MFNTQRPKFVLSLLATAIALSTSAQAAESTITKLDKSTQVVKETKLENDKSIERLTVYGRHNQLILNSGTATKSSMSLMETPAAIVVVDRILLETQAAATLQDSLRNVSGLSQAGNNYGLGDNLLIRGLGANYTYDGMYGGAGLDNNYNPTRSTTNIESVEVLKGPATGLYGIGSAGGVINLIEKKPQQKEAYQVKAIVGQWGNRGLMFDATAGLSDDIAYRLVANTETTDGYRGLGSKRNEIYGSLFFNINDNQTLNTSVAYIDDENQIDSVGHPTRLFSRDLIDGLDGEGTITADDIPNDVSDTGLQLTDAQREELASTVTNTDGLKPFDLGSQGVISPISTPTEGKELRIKLDYTVDFSQDTMLRQQLQYREYESDGARQTGANNYVYTDRNGVTNVDPRAPLVIDNVLYPYAARRQEYRRTKVEENSFQYFADFNSDWSLGDFEGEHLVSANYENRDVAFKRWSIWDADYTTTLSDGSVYQGEVPYILDIRDPNWSDLSFDDFNPLVKANYDKSVIAYGISFQEVIYFSDMLTGRFGLAKSRIEQEYTQKITSSILEDETPNDQTDDGSSYNVGLNYRITPEFATFVNFSKGVTAYSVLSDVEDEIPNAESKSFDVGVRFTAFDEELLGSFVYFETSKTHIQRTTDLFRDNKADGISNVGITEFTYDDENRTEGVEFDMNLAINDQWSMNVNGTYQEAVEIRNEDEDPISSQRKGIPKKFGSIWANYSPQFSMLDNPIKLSLGVTYTGERSINSASFGLPDASIDSYTVLDAAVSYNVNDWDIQLNLRNLTDETYYSKALFLGGLPGDSRNAKLTVKYNF